MQGGIAVPDEGDFFAGIKRSVADRAVGNPLARQLLFMRKTQMFVFDARRDDHALRLAFGIFRPDRKALSLLFHGKNLFQFDFRPQRGNLLEQPVRKIAAGNFLDGGEIFHPRRIGDLPAESFLFQNGYAFTVP